ncbi:MAG: coniferyl aldehyde dehydrogenase [Parvularculaceae bacterium]|nr:coniferyl aldehyde dehydrogenase [Parvularculaceae bacterium]
MPDTARSSTRDASQGKSEIDRLFALQKAAFAREPFPTLETRRSRLDALIRAVEKNEARIVRAIDEDFGCRPRVETLLAETIITVAAAKAAKRALAQWMRPKAVATPLHMLPAKSRLEPQPLGVVGIIAPWNYPVQLALSPLAAALAAGNRVMLKPSELTPNTASLLKEILAAEFAEDVVGVVLGGVETGEAFAEVPFDHLLFTGSTAIGRKVALAAARNLTPVTLELGGKSPAIIDDSADLAKAALSIARGKLFNAGQTCVAPDYVLAPRAKLDATIEALAAGARKLYPEIDTTKDYASIVSDRHFARLKAMVAEARDAGCRIVEIGSSNALHPQRKLPLTLVVEPPARLAVMQEEIFGPVLPVLAVDGPEAAVAHVNRGERPLALYWFGSDAARCDRTLRETVSGGVTVNDTLFHVAQENLPFGGVGKSGQGAYHGEAGFRTFSHMKPVFYQKGPGGALLQPPYTEKTDRTLGLARKLM